MALSVVQIVDGALLGGDLGARPAKLSVVVGGLLAHDARCTLVRHLAWLPASSRAARRIVDALGCRAGGLLTVEAAAASRSVDERGRRLRSSRPAAP
jgi:hypothetical protein